MTESLKYRVVWRELGSFDWQIRDFGTDQAAARRFHRQNRNALKASIVKWWHEAEQRWIG